MILSIEFGSNIKFVEGYKKKDLLLISKAATLDVSAEFYNVDNFNIDLTAKVIHDALVKNNIKAKKAVFIINSETIIIRKLRLPLLKKRSETLSMILLNLGQLVPADLNQYRLMYKIIDTYDDGGIISADYVVYCLPYNLYKKYIQLAEMLKLRLIGLDITSNILNNISELSLELNKSMVINNEIIAFIEIDSNRITFNTLNNGVNDFFRTMACRNNSERVAESQSLYFESASVSESKMMNWLAEINRCIRYYHSIDKKRIDKLYIYGHDSKAWGLSGFLQSLLNIDVKIITSLSGLVFEDDTNVVNEYFIPILALTNVGSHNFLTDHKDYNMIFKISVITVFVVVFFSLLLYMFGNFGSLQYEIKRISLFVNDEENIEHNRKIEDLKNETILLEGSIKSIETSVDTINKKFLYSKILRDIYYAIPGDTKVLSLSANRSSVSMQCISASIKEVTLLLNNLGNVEFIKEISIPEVELGQGTEYSFSVICELKDVID